MSPSRVQSLITDLCRSWECFKVDQDPSRGLMDGISAYKISPLDIEEYLFRDNVAFGLSI
jgi:hypothetical protein